MIYSQIHRYLFRSFFTLFAMSLSIFSLFIQTLDLVFNLFRYLDASAPLVQVLLVQLYYLPTSLSFAFPISILFTISQTVSNFSMRNELIIISASGISMFQFVIPLIAMIGLMCAGFFAINDMVVIEATRKKNELQRKLLNQDVSQDNSNVVVINEEGNVLYYASFFDKESATMQNGFVLKLKDNFEFDERINFSSAIWEQDTWFFERVNRYSFDKESKRFLRTYHASHTDETIKTSPAKFERIADSLSELRFRDAYSYIQLLREQELPYHQLLYDLYARVPFAFSSLVISLITFIIGASIMHSSFLFSLLLAIIIAIVYYSLDLVGSVLVSREVLLPFFGAAMPMIVTVLFTLIIFFVVRRQ